MTNEHNHRLRIAQDMHEIAEDLERSEAVLHESAERAADAQTRRRLHALGDDVTAQAEKIESRAAALADDTTAAQRPS